MSLTIKPLVVIVLAICAIAAFAIYRGWRVRVTMRDKELRIETFESSPAGRIDDGQDRLP
jgi:hypothetical protein